MLSAMLYGLRTSLFVGVFAGVLAIMVGVGAGPDRRLLGAVSSTR